MIRSFEMRAHEGVMSLTLPARKKWRIVAVGKQRKIGSRNGYGDNRALGH